MAAMVTPRLQDDCHVLECDCVSLLLRSGPQPHRALLRSFLQSLPEYLLQGFPAPQAAWAPAGRRDGPSG